jgi:hypothetical protein
MQTPRQWQDHLNQAQLTAHVMIEEIRELLTSSSGTVTGHWEETYQYLGSLNMLEVSIMSASIGRRTQ